MIETREDFLARVQAAANTEWQAASERIQSRGKVRPRRDRTELDERVEWTVRRYVCGESLKSVAARAHVSEHGVREAIRITARLLELPPLPIGRPRKPTT